MTERDLGASPKEQHFRRGTLEVISGCMFGGKTEELIRRLRSAKIAQEEIQAFKASIDTRYGGKDKLNSHSGLEWAGTIPIDPATPIGILGEVKQETSVVAIDEAQFFTGELVKTCEALVKRQIRVIVAGLDTDFRGEPFGSMPNLMAVAEKLDKYPAICQICGEDASFTQRIVNGQPARYGDPVVVVGASELYEARCRKHHEVPGRPERKSQ